MPQATNRQLVRDMNNTPVGRGTVYNEMLKISATTRERARKANEGEQLRLDKVARLLERHQRVTDHVTARVQERVQQGLKEMRAFQHVLQDRYSVRHFRTLQPSPVRMSNRRRKLETMFYHSGFSQKAMQPEIKRQMKKEDPEYLRRKFKAQILARSRQEVVRLVARNTMLSRTLTAPLSPGQNLQESTSATALTPAPTQHLEGITIQKTGHRPKIC